MKKELLVLMSFSLMVACSSGSKSSDSEFPEPAVEGDDYSAPADAGSRDRRDSPSARAEESRPVTSTTRSDAQVLADAIKSEHEESIVKAATMVLSKNPADPKALNALGFYHYRKGHYAAAQLMFGKAIKADPNFSDAHNNLGLAYLAQKENREAIKEFRKALEVNPNDGIAAANLGAIYVENKEYNKALVAMEIAYRKNSKDPRILNNYGVALAANKKFSEAKDMYKQALSINSNNKEVMMNYAILLIENLNQTQEGLDLLGKVKFLGPSPEARNRINLLENKAKAGLK